MPPCVPPRHSPASPPIETLRSMRFDGSDAAAATASPTSSVTPAPFSPPAAVPDVAPRCRQGVARARPHRHLVRCARYDDAAAARSSRPGLHPPTLRPFRPRHYARVRPRSACKALPNINPIDACLRYDSRDCAPPRRMFTRRAAPFRPAPPLFHLASHQNLRSIRAALRLCTRPDRASFSDNTKCRIGDAARIKLQSTAVNDTRAPSAAAQIFIKFAQAGFAGGSSSLDQVQAKRLWSYSPALAGGNLLY
ncbi:hypothetical protein C8R46DRAFT_1357562 [Mycena filopes]|nr:hypothetical protein C8R46DRAFT_1357562 [Mycena filopes]